jgi:acyl-coenzyme A synthetase/AMP-(fatty) acid ligase
VEFRAALPKSSTGKVAWREIQAEVQAETQSDKQPAL